MYLVYVYLLALLAICQYSYGKKKPNLDWWKTSIVYQIYPRSFKDSNGDGIGDLNGITSKLDYIKDIGADAIWLSPIYSSPQIDFGYDVSNFTNIDPQFGTLSDFEALTSRAKELGLKVMLDFVPNHSSSYHPWFLKSVLGISPYDDYYIWKDPIIVNGTRQPPNNWLALFGGSAWEWNNYRQQYYLHQFAVGQPDLNYRNSYLNQEMKDALTFWMDRGVEGFRVDSMNFIFEDPNFPNEPPSGNDVPSNDYEYLNHIYTKDLVENYGLVAQWNELITNYQKEHNTDAIFMLLEAYANITSTLKFYSVGGNPFNFMFVTTLNKNSSAQDFKTTIEYWLNNMGTGSYANWVVGNHDNPRVASRYGYRRADQITMLAAVLPGITVLYNGDEIGMVDREMTYEETVDPYGCNAGPDRYYLVSRDPERTPFQWDDSTSAGFSTSTNTWLPVNENYITLNLAVQKDAKKSHYKLFKKLTKLKNLPIMVQGTTEVLASTNNVLAVVRRYQNRIPVVLLVNFSDNDVNLDLRSWLGLPVRMTIFVASVSSGLENRVDINTSSMTIPGSASVILSRRAIADIRP